MKQHVIRISRAALVAGALGLTGIASGAAAQEWRMAFGFAESYSVYPELVAFTERLTEMGLPTRIYPSGQLLTAAESSPGLRDGLADIAWVVMPYHAAEFSESMTIANLSMLATSGEPHALPGAAMNGAAMEYTLLNCPKCLEQFKAQNQVYLSGASSGPYVLGCTKPIRSLADLQGVRMRGGAGNFIRWIDYLGGAGLQMPGNETYDALDKGAIDCSTHGMADLKGARYLEVMDAITFGAPGGVFPSLGIANFNLDVWRELSTEQRAQILRHAVRTSAEATLKFASDDKVAYDYAKEQGKHEMIDLPADIAEASAKFIAADMAVIEKELAEKYGIENAAEKVALARGLVEKWKGLTKDLTLGDVEALEKLYWDQVFAKLDLSTYGME